METLNFLSHGCLSPRGGSGGAAALPLHVGAILPRRERHRVRGRLGRPRQYRRLEDGAARPAREAGARADPAPGARQQERLARGALGGRADGPSLAANPRRPQQFVCRPNTSGCRFAGCS